MFSIGDTVTYGINGVCRIESETTRKVKGENKKYLVLKPVFQDNATVYVPLDNEGLVGRMKKTLTNEEAQNIIESIPQCKEEWISSDGERTKKFKEIMMSGDSKALTKMVRTLYLHREKQFAKGRKLHASDEHLLHDAENILFGELALALGILPEEVPAYIHEKIS